MTKEEEFLLNVRQDIRPSSCWIWVGKRYSVYGRGYDYLGYGKFGNEYAHRAAFSIFIGQVPTGKWVHQSCGNSRPSHLSVDSWKKKHSRHLKDKSGVTIQPDYRNFLDQIEVSDV